MGKRRTGYEFWETCDLLKSAQNQIARAELNLETGQNWRFILAQLREARMMVHECWERGEQMTIPFEK